VGLFSFQFLCWAPKDGSFSCNRVCIGYSSSSKVQDFSTYRKRICDFLYLVRRSNLGPILHRFWVWDTATFIGWKLQIFHSLSHLAPPLLLVSPWMFTVKLTMKRLELLNLSLVKTACMHDRRLRSVSHFDTVLSCDRRSDWQTDGRTDLLWLVQPYSWRSVKTAPQYFSIRLNSNEGMYTLSTSFYHTIPSLLRPKIVSFRVLQIPFRL